MKKLFIALIVFMLFPTYVTAFPADYSDTRQETTYDELDALARRLDAVYDNIPSHMFTEITNEADVYHWVQEVVPFFTYEEVTSEEYEYYGMKYPRSISFVYDDTAEGHIHVLGRADCFSSDVEINARFLNEKSPLFGNDMLLSVIIHELAHIQGVCWGETRLNAEVSAQLVTLEIMSAMVNRGNEQVFGPLVSELRYMALAAASARAEQEGRASDFDKLLLDTGTFFDKAKSSKSDRYWEHDKERQNFILQSYNYVPIGEILFAKNHECAYYDIDLETIASGEYSFENPIPYKIYNDPRPCIRGVVIPLNIGVFNKPLYIDDLSFILEHLEEFVQ